MHFFLTLPLRAQLATVSVACWKSRSWTCCTSFGPRELLASLAMQTGVSVDLQYLLLQVHEEVAEPEDRTDRLLLRVRDRPDLVEPPTWLLVRNLVRSAPSLAPSR